MTQELNQIVERILASGGNLNVLTAEELTLHIKIEGDCFDSSITGEVARSLWALQENVYRAAAEVLHGEPNIKKLTSDEREKLTLNFKIQKGCTNALVNIKDAATEIGKGFREMESKDKKAVFIALIVGAFLGYTSTSVVNAVTNYLSTKAAESAMVEQAKVLADPINKAIELSAMSIAKSTKGARSAQVGHAYQYDEEEIRQLNTKAERQPAATDTYDASFTVHGVELAGKKLKVTLIDDTNGATVTATLPGKDLFDDPLPHTAQEIAALIDKPNAGVKASILIRETKTKIDRVIVSWSPFER